VKHTDQLTLFKEVELLPDDNEHKKCSNCGVVKSLELFPWRGSDRVYRRETCVQCVRYLKKIIKTLKEKHGMPDNSYKCPICLGTKEEVDKRGGRYAGSWVLDHCHNTDQFRGWLCHLCNRALGCFKDDVNMLQRAIEYLNNNGEDYE